MSEIIQGYKKELADAKEVSYCLFVCLFVCLLVYALLLCNSS